MSCISVSMSSVARAATLGVQVVAILLLAACATTRLEAPTVSVERVRIDRMTNVDAQFTVVVNLVNPNERAIGVETIDADLRIEDIAIGTAHLAEPVRLPARGEATASLTVRAGWAATLRAAAEVARRAESANGEARTVRYGVSGVATLDAGRTIPFSRTGEFAWSRSGAAAQ